MDLFTKPTDMHQYLHHKIVILTTNSLPGSGWLGNDGLETLCYSGGGFMDYTYEFTGYIDKEPCDCCIDCCCC